MIIRLKFEGVQSMNYSYKDISLVVVNFIAKDL